LPIEGDLDLEGINISPEDMKELMKVDSKEWRAEIPDIEQHFATFGNRLPERLRKQLKEFITRLK
jgi:phosphoenolpyruvate carboxykinase (GTP)